MANTRTFAWKNDQALSSIFFGKIKDGDVLKMRCTVPYKFDVIFDTHRNAVAEGATVTVTATGAELKEKEGGDIFFRLVERLGKGKVRLHTIGVVRVKGNWQFERNELDVQFYTKGHEIFTPQLKGQLELRQKLETIARGDSGIPSIEKFVHTNFPSGTIKWFNPFLMKGVIASDSGDVFFHFNNCLSHYRHGCLKPGTPVSYSSVPSEGTFKQKAAWLCY